MVMCSCFLWNLHKFVLASCYICTCFLLHLYLLPITLRNSCKFATVCITTNRIHVMGCRWPRNTGHDQRQWDGFSRSRKTHVGHVSFVYILWLLRFWHLKKCEIPCCHGCTCGLLMRVRDLEHKSLNGHDASLLGACLIAVNWALGLRPLLHSDSVRKALK